MIVSDLELILMVIKNKSDIQYKCPICFNMIIIEKNTDILITKNNNVILNQCNKCKNEIVSLISNDYFND